MGDPSLTAWRHFAVLSTHDDRSGARVNRRLRHCVAAFSSLLPRQLREQGVDWRAVDTAGDEGVAQVAQQHES